MYLPRRFFLILTLLFITAFVFVPKPEAKAIDPVTLAILTPLAIQGAKIMAPYVAKALANMGKVLLKSGMNMINIFRLPLGFLQMTILAPWCFSSGLGNIWKGLCAPFQACFYLLLIPISPFGVGV